MQKLRRRFWIETVLAVLTLLAGLIAALWPRWIEAVSAAEPDGGSGLAEWAVAAGLLTATVVFGLAARIEWRRARATDLSTDH